MKEDSIHWCIYWTVSLRPCKVNFLFLVHLQVIPMCTGCFQAHATLPGIWSVQAKSFEPTLSYCACTVHPHIMPAVARLLIVVPLPSLWSWCMCWSKCAPSICKLDAIKAWTLKHKQKLVTIGTSKWISFFFCATHPPSGVFASLCILYCELFLQVSVQIKNQK